MSSKNSAAKKLKRLGFINYDLRKKLHWKQKEKIEKLAREYSEVLTRPQQFIRRSIGKETAKNLERAGYKTFKDAKTGKTKSLIRIESDATSVRISKGRVTVKYDGFTEKWLIGVAPQNLRDELIRLKKVQAKNPYNFQITGKIGDNQPFKHSRFLTVEEFEKYLSAWKINFPLNVTGQRARDNYRDELIQHLSVVEINDTFRQGEDDDEENSDY